MLRKLTEYGKTVKITLIELGQTQSWLISEIKKKLPDKYVDSSNLGKIFTGEINSPEIISAINEILGI